jgi:Zn-dependent peptidase ImmA (M78 family)
LLRILERERIRIYQARLPNPAMLVPYHGSWTIIVAKGSDSTKHKQYVAHELAHIWFHVDAGVGRFEHCLNYTYPESADPREQEAEYLSLAILFGPKVFLARSCQRDSERFTRRAFQPAYVKAGRHIRHQSRRHRAEAAAARAREDLRTQAAGRLRQEDRRDSKVRGHEPARPERGPRRDPELPRRLSLPGQREEVPRSSSITATSAARRTSPAASTRAETTSRTSGSSWTSIFV